MDKHPLPPHLLAKALPTVVGAQQAGQDFQKMKEDALDLLDWTLADASPDAQHKLHLKIGMEREGHFIPDGFEKDPKILDTKGLDDRLATEMHLALKDRFTDTMERIYWESTGAAIMELTTKPIAPKLSALAVRDISKAMLEYAQTKDIKGHFGPVDVSYIKGREEEYKTQFSNFKSEVFQPQMEPPTDAPYILAGRGHHANISLWCGDTNMFFRSPIGYDQKNLGRAVANEAMHTLPGMMLPCRHGSYWHLNNSVQGGLHRFDLSYNKKEAAALNWVMSDEKNKEAPQYYRLEFRVGAAEADPLDVALTAAIPTTKAFLENTVKDEQGKVRLQEGLPQFDWAHIKAPRVRAVPHSQEEAIKLFNTPDNPNFLFLDELAERKIARLEERLAAGGDKAVQQELRDAKKLKGLGAKLHHAYCEAYKLESPMALPEISAEALRQ